VGFAAPWFLAGLLAVGLPLWLHLLRQYKRTPTPFSSLMFFERRVQSSVRHRRLRYLLLLAMRLALLILLALAFSNPFINRRSEIVGRRKLTLIAIDRSFSMRAGNRLADAKNEAHRVVDSLGGRDMAQVAAVDAHLEALTQYESDKGALNAAIDSITATDSPSSYGEFARALRVMDKNGDMHIDAHLISDMQQTSMPSQGFKDLQLETHTTLTLHPVATGETPNWAVETVSIPAQVYDPKQTRLSATIAGWATPAASRKVELVLNGKLIASKDIALTPNGRAQVEFNGFDVPYGDNRGELRIEPQDSLPLDDSYAFSLHRADPRRVLFLYANGRNREALYYKSAMESSAATGLTVTSAPLEQAATEDFSKFAFVVLSDPGDLGSAAAQALCDYVGKGGAVLIAAGTNTGFAGKIPMSSDKASIDHEAQGAGYVDDQHPALIGTGKFENVQFLQSVRLQPKADARILAKLADGSPLLIEERMGEGRVLTLAATLDNVSNDFPLHSSFLPFVVQSGHYLAGADDVESSIVAGTPITLRRTEAQVAAADVIGPDGKHELPLSQASKAMTYEPLQSGFYEVQTASGRRSLYAVNADRRESDLTRIPDETLVLWRNTGNTSSEAKAEGVHTQTVPWSLWRYVLLVVLAAAVMEAIFGSRYLKEERQTA
jgi:hypothetical protein